MVDEAQTTSGTLARSRESIAEEAEGKASDEVTIPVVEEQVRLAKNKVATGRVSIRKEVETTQATTREPVLRERVTVERVQVNQPVEHAPSLRVEGDTTIIPVVEEIIEVRKRLVLREEVHIKKQIEHETAEAVTELRKERVHVDRLAVDGTPREEGDESWTAQ